ncbi:hypothetical protein [Streptomyces sp. NPDC093060]|uniref:hypothetical protein n=1 Tax=Streptomyces sp. NPDC093060 TaxID=3366019 RepID=UPI00381C7201
MKSLRRALAITGGVVGAAALALGRGKALRRPLLALGAVVTATAVVVRRPVSGAKDTSPDTEHAPRSSLPSLLEIVGPHKPRLVLASGLSAVCQLAEVACGLFLGWIALVLIKGSRPPLLALGLTGASAQLWFLAAAAAVACAAVAVAVARLSYAANVEWRRLGQAVQHDWRPGCPSTTRTGWPPTSPSPATTVPNCTASWSTAWRPAPPSRASAPRTTRPNASTASARSTGRATCAPTGAP